MISVAQYNWVILGPKRAYFCDGGLFFVVTRNARARNTKYTVLYKQKMHTASVDIDGRRYALNVRCQKWRIAMKMAKPTKKNRALTGHINRESERPLEIVFAK